MKSLRLCLKGIDLFVLFCNKIAIVAVFALFVFIVLNILSRLLLFQLEGTAEISELLLGGVSFLALGYAQRERAHVKAVAALSLLPSKWQSIIGIFIEMILLAMFVLITWKMGQSTYKFWQTKACTYGTIELPKWIANFIASIGFASLGLTSLSSLVTGIFGTFADSNK
jgi:TRAP-type C4-dicarboxylate transport system permease small subunit